MLATRNVWHPEFRLVACLKLACCCRARPFIFKPIARYLADEAFVYPEDKLFSQDLPAQDAVEDKELFAEFRKLFREYVRYYEIKEKHLGCEIDLVELFE